MNAGVQQSKLLAQRTDMSILEDSTRRIPPRFKLEKLEKTAEKVQEATPLNILVITWNLMGTLPSQQYVEHLLNKERLKTDLIVIGTQECQRSLFNSFFCESKETWENLLTGHLEEEFVRVGADVLQGLHTIAFIRKELHGQINDISTNKIKTGFLGLVGNKGAVQLELRVGDQQFLFINTHLQAMQEQSRRRNHDLMTIVARLVEGQPADHVFFFGDLNYRVAITIEEARRLNSNIDNYKTLLHKDQLVLQDDLKSFLGKYQEWPITFPPSYKMSTEKNTYNNNRIPGWTDRIFHNSRTQSKLQQTSYICDFQVFGSDHRPVLATFSTSFRRRTEQLVEVRASQSRCSVM